MGKVMYNLLPGQKARRHNLRVEIDIYRYAEELQIELDHIGIMTRLKEIPQLGIIKVSRCLLKTRYDYIMLQLYLHQLIKTELQQHLKLTYNNFVREKEFCNDYKYLQKDWCPSIGDILQLLTIVYNIGHFYNTFTSSKAVVTAALENCSFYNMVLKSSDSSRYQKIAREILNSRNYQRLHLLNSILILEKCDQTKPSVSLALEILYAYLNESALAEDSKLKYVFKIFRNVRTVSYMAYDLQISETPLTIDFCDKDGMKLLLQELLSEYNNNQPSIDLVKSITKMLDDYVYYENFNTICYNRISRTMVSLITGESMNNEMNYYTDCFLDKNSIFNRQYIQRHDYDQSPILKITFSKEERDLSSSLLSSLDTINNTRVGYYDRHSGEQTILVSIKSSCSLMSKKIAALKVLKCTIKFLRKISDIKTTDDRFLLCTKFFLFYLFNENSVVIKPTIDEEKCVICTRGKKARVMEIEELLTNSIGDKDKNHEVEFLLRQLKCDLINDTSITIPASIIVYQGRGSGRELSEFDGLIIHPMRKDKQVVFLEAKNRDRQPGVAKKCLGEKFDVLSFDYSRDEIITVDHDAFWTYSL